MHSKCYLAEEVCADLKGRMGTDGYFTVERDSVSEKLAMALADGVRQLHAQGWPATFIMLFDEAWELVNKFSPLMEAVTGNKCNYDVVAWHIDPDSLQGGFTPHRDRAIGSLDGPKFSLI